MLRPVARGNGRNILDTFILFSMLRPLPGRSKFKTCFFKGIYLKRLLKDEFYLIFEREIQIWPDVLVKKVTMNCNKMKACTEAYFPHKIIKPTIFS